MIGIIIVFAIVIISLISIGKIAYNHLCERIEELESSNVRLEDEVFFLKNPTKYKIGEIVEGNGIKYYITDVFIRRNHTALFRMLNVVEPCYKVHDGISESILVCSKIDNTELISKV